MASEKQPLSIVYSATALDELQGIWRWNAERYSPAHADAYISFLRSRIERLSYDHGRGRAVPHRDDLRYVVIQRRPKSHGHIAVYSVGSSEVGILHVFHTAQDWRSRIEP